MRHRPAIESVQDLLVYQESVQTAVSNCTATDENTQGVRRSNPVPMGEWLTFTAGDFRITGITSLDTVPDGAYYTLPEGHYIIQIDMEYLCVREDENATCHGGDFANISIVTSEAALLPPEPNLGSSFFNQQVFNSGTITGVVYFVLPNGITTDTMQVLNRMGEFEPFFFSLIDRVCADESRDRLPRLIPRPLN